MTLPEMYSIESIIYFDTVIVVCRDVESALHQNELFQICGHLKTMNRVLYNFNSGRLISEVEPVPL